MILRYLHILLRIISIFLLISCASAATEDSNLKFIDPAKIDAEYFSVDLGTDRVVPGKSYELNVVLYDSSSDIIPGKIDPRDLSVISENNSFAVEKNIVTASSDILKFLKDGYCLTVGIENSGLDPESVKLGYDIIYPENILVNSKRPVFETAFYDISELSGRFNDVYILVHEKSTGTCFLAPPMPLDIYLGEMTERVIVLYTMNSNLFLFINFYSAESMNEEVRTAWNGLKVQSPLATTDLLFTEMQEYDFNRDYLRDSF